MTKSSNTVTEQGSAVNVAMQKLTEQWYNAVVNGLGLSPEQFQLYQGAGSAPTTSQEMWNIFNVVPPKSINNYFDPAQINNFAPDYNLILTSLVAGSDSDFQNCMGDYYMKWQDYINKNVPNPMNADTLTKAFTNWAVLNAPGKAGCVSGLTKALINPVALAIQSFAAADGKYAWNKTVDQLQSNLASGQAKSFVMNSLTESSDTTHTWAGGNTSIFFDLFSFGGGGGYDKLTTKTTSEGITIDAKFDRVTTFASGPLSVDDDNNPILKDYQAWYNSAVMALAYSTKDNTVWNNQAPVTWEKAFGPNGFLQRLTSAIVAVEGITFTMESKAKFTSEEQTQIKAAAKVGIWPFFTASGSGGFTNTVTFNDQGNFKIETKCALGNPQIMGVLQTATKDAFSK